METAHLYEHVWEWRLLSSAVKSAIINPAHIEFFLERVYRFFFRHFSPLCHQQSENGRKKPFPEGKRSSVDPLYPESALCCGRSSWQVSSSQQERKWLSGAVLNSPSTGRKSSLNEAVSRIGHAVRAHQSSHPLIRLQYFQHPFTGKKKKLNQGSWDWITIKRAYGYVIVQV